MITDTIYRKTRVDEKDVCPHSFQTCITHTCVTEATFHLKLICSDRNLRHAQSYHIFTVPFYTYPLET